MHDPMVTTIAMPPRKVVLEAFGQGFICPSRPHHQPALQCNTSPSILQSVSADHSAHGHSHCDSALDQLTRSWRIGGRLLLRKTYVQLEVGYSAHMLPGLQLYNTHTCLVRPMRRHGCILYVTTGRHLTPYHMLRLS